MTTKTAAQIRGLNKSGNVETPPSSSDFWKTHTNKGGQEITRPGVRARDAHKRAQKFGMRPPLTLPFNPRAE